MAFCCPCPRTGGLTLGALLRWAVPPKDDGAQDGARRPTLPVPFAIPDRSPPRSGAISPAAGSSPPAVLAIHSPEPSDMADLSMAIMTSESCLPISRHKYPAYPDSGLLGISLPCELGLSPADHGLLPDRQSDTPKPPNCSQKAS